MTKKLIDYSSLPEHCQLGMKLYIEQGVPPGSFIRAVLENDLQTAYVSADKTNINSMSKYVTFLIFKAPGLCWGDREKVSQWISRGGLKKIKATEKDALMTEHDKKIAANNIKKILGKR